MSDNLTVADIDKAMDILKNNQAVKMADPYTYLSLHHTQLKKFFPTVKFTDNDVNKFGMVEIKHDRDRQGYSVGWSK